MRVSLLIVLLSVAACFVAASQQAALEPGTNSVSHEVIKNADGSVTVTATAVASVNVPAQAASPYAFVGATLGGSCVSGSRTGTCQVDSTACAGGYVSGACPGTANNVRCCLRPITTTPTQTCSSGGRSGVCQVDSISCGGGYVSGACPGTPGNVRCCLSGTAPTTPTTPTTPAGSCGSNSPYNNIAPQRIAGNGGTIYNVVPVARQHLDDPSIFGVAPTAKDNTMTVATACAFNRMAEAAARAGVTIKIASAFRTLGRQQYFWDCYQTGRCNNGNKAAPPGTSNHGIGIALDLNTRTGAGVYNWLKANALSYGFIRTVPSEIWHWEHRPGQPRPSWT